MITSTTPDAESLRPTMEENATSGQLANNDHKDFMENPTTSALTWNNRSNHNFVESFSGSSSVGDLFISTSTTSYVENHTAETTNDSTTSAFATQTFDVVEGEVHAVEYRIGLGCLMCLVMSVAIAGNFLVLLAITRTRSLRRLNNFLLVSLAVSDFLSAITCMPLFIMELFNDYEWTLPNAMCSYYISLQLSLMFLSTWNIAAISLERVFLIMFPMIYQRAVTERRMLVFIIGLWVLSLIYGMSQLSWFNSEPWLSWSVEHPQFCRYVPSIVYAIVDFVVCFALPLCIMFGAYLKIYCIVQSQMSRIHPMIPETNAWADAASEFSTTNYMSHIYNEKMKNESQFSCASNPAEERNTDSSGNYRRQRETSYDDFVAHALRKISTQYTDVQSLGGVDQVSRPVSESESSDTTKKQHLADDPAAETAWEDGDHGALPGTCSNHGDLTENDPPNNGDDSNGKEMLYDKNSIHHSPQENVTNHSHNNGGGGGDNENTKVDDIQSVTPSEHHVQNHAPDSSTIELTNPITGPKITDKIETNMNVLYASNPILQTLPGATPAEHHTYQAQDNNSIDSVNTMTGGKITGTIEKNVNISNTKENVSDPILQQTLPPDTYLQNEIEFVTSNHSPNLQLRTTEVKLNRDLRNYTAQSPNNLSANGAIDPPTNQNDPNQSEKSPSAGGWVRCGAETEMDQIHIQGNDEMVTLSPKSSARRGNQSVPDIHRGITPSEDDGRKDEIPLNIDDVEKVKTNDEVQLNIDDVEKVTTNDEIPLNIDDVEDNPEKAKTIDDRPEVIEDDVFPFPVLKQLRHTSSDLETTLKKVSDLTNTLNIPIDDSLATVIQYSRSHSHEGERSKLRSKTRPLRCFSDPEPERTMFNAGIEINTSRSSSKDGFAFPLRRASSARPDLNSVSLDLPTTTTSSYSGFRTKLHPVLKTSFKTASTGNLPDHRGPTTQGRKRNSVVFRLYDDEIFPDDDPNIVHTIPKFKVSVGTTEDTTTTTETSGIGTTETTLTPDNSIASNNDAITKRSVRGENAPDPHPSKTHTSQWTKKHFNVSRDQSTTSVRSQGGSGTSSLRASSITRRFRENKAVRMTAAVIGAFVLCILPYKIVFMLRVRDMGSVSDMGWNVVSLLMFVTAALNPFIYNFYNSSFRAAIRRLILCKETPVAPTTT